MKIIFPSHEQLISRRMGAIPAPPLSLEYLAGLTPPEVEVRLIDMGAGDNPGLGDSVDLVAIHTRTPCAATAYRLAEDFRSQGVRVVLGGPHPTLMPAEAIAHADAICIGEAEETWPVLLEDFERGKLRRVYAAGSYDLSSLPGPVYHVPHLPKLKGVPQPRRNLFPPGRYMMEGVFVSRGCPYNCKFCAVKQLQGALPRHRPVEEVLTEVAALNKDFFLAEENALGYPGDWEYYLNLFREMARMPGRRKWSGASTLAWTASEKGREVLRAAVESGLFFTAVGFETLSSEAAECSGVLGKLGYHGEEKLDPARQKEAVRIYQDHGVIVMGYFVLGLDGDTPESYARILDFCDETQILPVFTVLAPMPGTDFHREYAEAGRLLPGVEWDAYGSDEVVFVHPTLSREEIRRTHIELWRQAYTPERIAGRVNHALQHYRRDFYFHIQMQLNLARVYPPYPTS